MRTRFTDLVLEHGIAMVVPSQSVATTLRQLDPRLAAVPMPVIGHGMDMDAPRIAYPARAAGERMRIVVLGRLSPAEGHRAPARRGAGPCAVRRRDDRRRRWKWRGARQGVWLEVHREIRGFGPAADPGRDRAPRGAAGVRGAGNLQLHAKRGLGAGNSPCGERAGQLQGAHRRRRIGLSLRTRKGLPGRSDSQTSSTPGSLETVAKFLASRPAGRTTAQMVADYDALIPMRGPSRRALPRGHRTRDRIDRTLPASQPGIRRAQGRLRPPRRRVYPHRPRPGPKRATPTITSTPSGMRSTRIVDDFVAKAGALRLAPIPMESYENAPAYGRIEVSKTTPGKEESE